MQLLLMMLKGLSMKEKILFCIYIFIILGFFLYSFTQIDLSLTFSRITFLRTLVKSFQYVGYFNRPLSTYLFLTFVGLLYGFYLFFLYLSQKKKISKKFVWQLLIASTVLLVFSYNAFSYDL